MISIVTLVLLAAAQASIGPIIGDHFEHGGGGPEQFALTLPPPKTPNCRTDEEIRKALIEKQEGLAQSCDPPKTPKTTSGR